MARPKKKAPKRQFGSTETLPSGRVRARYSHRGKRWKSPRTFATPGQAQGWLSAEQRLIDLQAWTPPAEREKQAEAEAVTVDEALDRWIRDAGHLGDRSRDRYQHLRQKHITPYIGKVQVGELSATEVQRWVDDLRRAHGGATATTAGAYTLLHTVMGRLVDRGVLPVQPCQVRGGGTPPRAKEKVVPTAEQLAALVATMPTAYKIAVQVAAWCALRPGEWAEVRRKDIQRYPQPSVNGESQSDRVVLHIRRQAHKITGGWAYDLPKGGKTRTVEVPPHIVPLLDEQLAERSQPGPEGLVFLNTLGTQVNPNALRKPFQARADMICPGMTPHSLRHFGAVAHQHAGATLRETMQLLGHSTPQVALSYQHVAHGRMSTLAARMSDLAAPTNTDTTDDTKDDQ